MKRKKTRRNIRYTRVLSGTALLMLSPLMAGICIAIKLDSKGPVIFKQERIGIHKSHFYIYKFRTMYADTPKDMPTHLLKNPDAMVTKVGRFLRKSSLDELPQLVNILKGEMSIVGPRPALWNQYDLIAEREKYHANDVLPGLTGWAQINGRDELEIPLKARLDGEYVRHFGFWMDIRCIIGTVTAVIEHRGVVEGGTGELERQKAGEAAKASSGSDIERKQPGKNAKKVLITGKGSYIGTAVRDWLLHAAEPYLVEELDMKGEGWKSHDFSRYDAVFHVAGIAHADVSHVSEEEKQLYYQVNRDLAVETAKKAKEAGVGQFIYMSSMIIYGDSTPLGERRRITAKTLPQPKNFYGSSKWQGEKGIRALETPWFHVCILRPPMIYGKGSKGNYPLLSKLARRMPIFPQVDNERSMLHIDHLCELVRLLVRDGAHGIFFPQNREYTNTSQMVKMIAKAHGKRLRLLKFMEPEVVLASGIPGKIGALTNKAFGNFSYEQSLSVYPGGEYRIHDLEESIRLTEKSGE